MSTVIFIFIAVILLAFIINLFGIISTKQLTMRLLAFLLLYASVRINGINIRNGVKMELNNLIIPIYGIPTHRLWRMALSSVEQIPSDNDGDPDKMVGSME